MKEKTTSTIWGQGFACLKKRRNSKKGSGRVLFSADILRQPANGKTTQVGNPFMKKGRASIKDNRIRKIKLPSESWKEKKKKEKAGEPVYRSRTGCASRFRILKEGRSRGRRRKNDAFDLRHDMNTVQGKEGERKQSPGVERKNRDKGGGVELNSRTRRENDMGKRREGREKRLLSEGRSS